LGLTVCGVYRLTTAAEKDFLISDSQTERKWKFKLSDSLERAKRDDGGANLLKGMTFYVTPKVEIDVKLLKAVVTSAGGQVSCLSKLRRRSASHHPHTGSDVKADGSNTQC